MNIRYSIARSKERKNSVSNTLCEVLGAQTFNDCFRAQKCLRNGMVSPGHIFLLAHAQLQALMFECLDATSDSQGCCPRPISGRN